MCLRPFCDKVGEGLRLDFGSSDVYDVKPVEIKGPLSIAFQRILILDDLAKGRREHHRHRVPIEVVDQLLLGDEDRIEQLLDPKVPCLGLC
jgi:hypothetical protein